MRNIIFLCASLLPFICVLAFADPIEGLFTRNLGSLSSTFIGGLSAFSVLKKYGNKNGIAASMAWLVILALTIWIASLFQ
jgi:hypothetical protein